MYRVKRNPQKVTVYWYNCTWRSCSKMTVCSSTNTSTRMIVKKWSDFLPRIKILYSWLKTIAKYHVHILCVVNNNHNGHIFISSPWIQHFTKKTPYCSKSKQWEFIGRMLWNKQFVCISLKCLELMSSYWNIFNKKSLNDYMCFFTVS